MSLDREKFHKPVKILRKLLKKFPRRPLPEHVHRLRTHTRRLDAVLRGLMLTSRRNERRLVEAIARLRKRAGKVRDMDVLAGFVCTLRVSGENDCAMPHGHGSSLGESKCVHECVGSFASALGRTGQSAAAGCRQLARLPQESQRTVLFAPILEPWQCPLCRDTGKSERCHRRMA